MIFPFSSWGNVLIGVSSLFRTMLECFQFKFQMMILPFSEEYEKFVWLFLHQSWLQEIPMARVFVGAYR